MFYSPKIQNENNIGLTTTSSVSPTVLTQVARLITTHYPGILLIPVRSLDHGIDMWNKVYEQ